MCDDFCKTRPLPAPAPGASASLTHSEVLTLCLFGQGRNFASERDFYRFALRHLRSCFPALPDRAQFNRLQRACYSQLVAFWQHLTRELKEPKPAEITGSKPAEITGSKPAEIIGCYEALDATAVATRHVSRRGSGWLVGQADKGLASRLGWYTGFYLLAATDPSGVFTG
jgi:hypothetical protein